LEIAITDNVQEGRLGGESPRAFTFFLSRKGVW
jgi:hypothetical protein